MLFPKLVGLKVLLRKTKPRLISKITPFRLFGKKKISKSKKKIKVKLKYCQTKLVEVGAIKNKAANNINPPSTS
jgi:hypothetical protein